VAGEDSAQRGRAGDLNLRLYTWLSTCSASVFVCWQVAMELQIAQLAAAIGCPVTRAQQWAGPLTAAMNRYAITSPKRMAAFLAQIGHESASLARVEENLSYSAARIRQLAAAAVPGSCWHRLGSRAQELANNPVALANAAYGGRMGNGEENSGDGWRYRGRGLLHVTGKTQYAQQAMELGLPLLDQPDLLRQPTYAALSAAAFWHDRRCNALADVGDFALLTRRINGGLNGFADRQRRYLQALKALAQ